LNVFKAKLTYAEVGATRAEPLPAGYRHLHRRTRVGTGARAFAAAGEAVVTFAMHRASGARIRAGGDRALPGVRLTVGLGPFTVPCQVVYAVDEPGRAGFGYGTLAGHQLRGEEAFVVERDAQDRVWFHMISFSRPARWAARLGGPLTVVFQHLYARRCGHSLKRLVAVSRTVGSWPRRA
jgi:uncharacterized protein (UPF0548 family)